MQLASNKIDDTMLITIDLGDIMKPYTKEMEKLCNIYDGSQGVPTREYHLCQVTAANLTHESIAPFCCEAYSSEDTDYTGSSEMIIKIVKKVKAKIGIKGIWAIDKQGYDKDEGLDFVVCLKINHYMHFGGDINRQVKAERMYYLISTPHKAYI